MRGRKCGTKMRENAGTGKCGKMRGQTGRVHPKTETEIMVTVLEQENTCHERARISRSMERS